MDIQFRTRALLATCTDGKTAQKSLGKRCADILRRRLDDLRASESLETMRHLPGHCHELRADRAGQFAVDLEHPRRLVFQPVDGARRTDGSLDRSTVTAIEVVEIIDYH
jgi:proteic killer suppression protein